jgi:hypothetical protein
MSNWDEKLLKYGELFVDGWGGAHAQRALASDLDWWVASMKESHAKGYPYLLNIIKNRGHRALLDPPRIHPGTIHSVKGGQADTVILFPDLSPSGAELLWSSDGAQVIRLFYVGITRAYHRLILCAPDGKHHVEILRSSPRDADVVG